MTGIIRQNVTRVGDARLVAVDAQIAAVQIAPVGKDRTVQAQWTATGMMFCWNDGWGSEEVREQTDNVKSNAAEE